MTDDSTVLECDVQLEQGQAIHLRPLRADDGDRVRRLLRQVEGDRADERFLGTTLDLNHAALRELDSLGHDGRMALVALHDGELVAVGRCDVRPERSAGASRVAEVAILANDAWRERGIGRHLLQHLTAIARRHGITEFEASRPADEVDLSRLLRAAGRQREESTLRAELPVGRSAEPREAAWEREKRAVTASLTPILRPTSVAVIGASRDQKSIGGRLLRNLVANGFTGPVYPVNPSTPHVHSILAYASVLDIPRPVDLAIIVVPAPAVRHVLEECGRKGVAGAVIITAGFGEVDEAGAALEADVLAAARRGGMRIVGPNCMGVINTDAAISLDGQFGPTFPPRGNVAIASQSGALGLAILEQTVEMNIGVSTFVSLGNGKDISASDLLLCWEDDPATDVVVLYMESFGRPRRFGRIARRVGRSKPVVVVKSGRSSAGARAAASHTGSLASVDVAVDALFARAGVIRTDTLHQLFDLTELLAHQPLPRGRRVGVLSNAGGPGILAADALEGAGMVLPELSPALQARLAAHLPGIAAPQNPVDMIASAGPEQYRACLELLLASDELDAVIVIYIPAAPEGTEEVIAAIHEAVAAQETPKTTIAVLMGSAHAAEVAGATVKLPVYPYPESAAHALSAAAQYREWREKPEGRIVRFADVDAAAGESVLRRAIRRLGREGGWLDSAEIEELLGAYGIRSARSHTAHDEDEAVRIAAEIGDRVVLKVIAPSALHKSDVGGVALDVGGEDAVRAAWRKVTAAVPDATGVLVQEFVRGGHEVIIGMTEDPVFGPLVVYGLGGIFVELMRDVAFRINPLTDLDAAGMLAEVKSAKLLTGYRGAARGDLEAVQELLLRVSALVEAHPQIAEIDLNPVKVLPPGHGAIVVDARMRVQPDAGHLPPGRTDGPG